MTMQVRGDKIVFPDGTKQTTAYDPSKVTDKDDQKAIDEAQNIQIEENKMALTNKVDEAPSDGNQYARQNKKWSKVNLPDGGITDAPKDGKTYGRKDEGWAEVSSDAYSKADMDAQQAAQDAEIAKKANKTDVYTKSEVDASQSAQDTKIDKNTTDIAKNKTDINTIQDDIDALTGSIVYKGSLNATVTPAPAGAVEGDMWINEYNVSDPSTNYPVASGWGPVTEVKYDDKLIKTDTGWDKIASVVGVPSYSAGEIDDLLDEKADKADTYTKTETDTLLDDKANVGDSYLKTETYTKVESDTALDLKADKATTYTKTEVDDSQALQNTEIAKKADTGDSYTKTEIDTQQKAQDDKIAVNTLAIDDNKVKLDDKADKIDTYTKDEVNELFDDYDDAINATYITNNGVATGRNPGEGKFYLLYGVNISTKYNEVTRIYVSATDGDGFVRQFSKLRADDEVQFVSENGSGQYKITTVTGMDSNTYYELGVTTLVSDGTIADNTSADVKITVDALSHTGIEEAPKDGKQYARQDEAWSEVEAGEGTVANGCIYLNNQTITDDYTIPTGKNGMSAGAIDFVGTVTVPTGSKYHVVDSTSTGGGTTGSIWTEVGDEAVYDGDIKVNDVTVGQGNNKDVKNTALGLNALMNDVGTGAIDAHGSNTAIGDRSMQALTTGYFNTAVGTATLQKTVDGYNNTALGRSALNYCTSGFDNIGIGREALFGDESTPNTGNSNIGIGTSAIHDCSTGEKNVAVGRSALHFLTSGNENVAIGQGAGNNLETGNNNILIGSGVDTETVNSMNQTVIGNDRTVKASLRGSLEVKSHTDDISLSTNANGRVTLNQTPSLSTTVKQGNVYMNESGALYLSTASTYTVEEVDKKLAIKDNIIEKLEARLTKLEARIK